MRKSLSIALAIGLVSITSLVAWLLYQQEKEHQQQMQADEEATLEETVEPAGSAQIREITIYVFRPEEGRSRRGRIVGEPFQLVETPDPAKRAHQIANAVIQASEPLVPPVARALQVYLFEDETAVVDLSRENADRFAGGIHAEAGFLQAIARSLTQNLEEVEQVRFLVDGQDQTTFAGHISINTPFR